MKKLLASLTILTILALPLGSAASAEQQTPPADLSVEEVHGNIPAQADAAQTMYPAVHSLVLAMTENDLEYAPEDSEFLWTSLYYMLSLCGQMDERAELTDDMLILPAETVADYAGALFSNFDGLPALPREMNGRVSYDWQNDTFRLARGDAGLTETRLGEITELGGARVQVAGALVSLEDESVLCSFTVDLVRNNSMFGYAISGLDIL